MSHLVRFAIGMGFIALSGILFNSAAKHEELSERNRRGLLGVEAVGVGAILILTAAL